LKAYRFGFNGQEKSPEIAEGHTTALYWEYDTRIGRRWNVDPEWKKYPNLSPYATFDDNPIFKKDPLGNDPITAILEAATAFGIEAGLEFMTNMIARSAGK
jgi:hypothetical protein